MTNLFTHAERLREALNEEVKDFDLASTINRASKIIAASESLLAAIDEFEEQLKKASLEFDEQTVRESGAKAFKACTERFDVNPDWIAMFVAGARWQHTKDMALLQAHSLGEVIFDHDSPYPVSHFGEPYEDYLARAKKLKAILESGLAGVMYFVPNEEKADEST